MFAEESPDLHRMSPSTLLFPLRVGDLHLSAARVLEVSLILRNQIIVAVMSPIIRGLCEPARRLLQQSVHSWNNAMPMQSQPTFS